MESSTSKHKSKFSKGEAIRFGWSKMKVNFWFFVVLLIIVGVVSSLPSMVGNLFRSIPVIAFLASIAAFVLSIIVQLGLIRVNLEFVDNKKPKYDDLFYYKPFINYLLASIVYGLIVGIGFLLLIIPGVILALRLQFFTYLLVEKGVGPIESLKKSWEKTKGNTWNLLLFWLLLAGINILGALALGIGLFATVPTTMVATAYVYRKLTS